MREVFLTNDVDRSPYIANLLSELFVSSRVI